jgi:hypothetical protein
MRISARELVAIADRMAARAERTEAPPPRRVRSDLQIAAAGLQVLASVCAGGVEVEAPQGPVGGVDAD